MEAVGGLIFLSIMAFLMWLVFKDSVNNVKNSFIEGYTGEVKPKIVNNEKKVANSPSMIKVEKKVVSSQKAQVIQDNIYNEMDIRLQDELWEWFEENVLTGWEEHDGILVRDKYLESNVLKIDNLRTKNLHKNIFLMSHVEKLVLSFLELKSIPSDIIKMNNLKELDVSYNELKVIPSEIFKIKSIQKIDLSFNPINFTEEQKVYVNDAIKRGVEVIITSNMTNMANVDKSYNPFT
jgi:Leucine-rich repeat (LRR) protein